MGKITKKQSETAIRRLYSSCTLGFGAVGDISLFTVPRGNLVPILGYVPLDLRVLNTKWHTTLNKAGELGVAIGDLSIDTVSTEFVGGSLRDTTLIARNTEFELTVCAKTVLKGALCDLPAWREMLKDNYVHRYDTLEVRLSVPTALELGNPVLVRFILDGSIKYDAVRT